MDQKLVQVVIKLVTMLSFGCTPNIAFVKKRIFIFRLSGFQSLVSISMYISVTDTSYSKKVYLEH